jgi:nucleotide-binding universal stress UspA family protein
MSKKFQIKKILVPFDFSETADLALDHATFMAKLHRADLILLHVVESFSFASALTSKFSKAQSEFDDKIENTATQKLQTLTEKLHHDSGMKVIHRTESGKIYKKIVNIAEESSADVIVMGTHGVSGFQDFLVGSNTYRVVMASPCPVISVQVHAKKVGFKDIVLPIDNSSSSRQKVKYAVEIAKHYNSIIHIAGMMTMSDVDLQRKFEVKIHQVQSYLEEHEVAHTAKIFKTDNSPSATLNYCSQINADLLIIMTDQEGSGIFMGNYAQQLINQSKIPVMSIRPDEGDPEKISLGY